MKIKKSKRRKQGQTRQKLMTMSKLFVIMTIISCLLSVHLIKVTPIPHDIWEIAHSQVGNTGGKKYWSWYGFDNHVDWCACFVSWCVYKAGFDEPKFSVCEEGKEWFEENERWQDKDMAPKAGMIIFFDSDGDKVPDHTGIVTNCKKGKIYTVEGNVGDKCKEKEYFYGEKTIIGYGII